MKKQFLLIFIFTSFLVSCVNTQSSSSPSIIPSSGSTTSEPTSEEPSIPSPSPSVEPSVTPPSPSVDPSIEPPINPSVEPSVDPSVEPPIDPSVEPSVDPSVVNYVTAYFYSGSTLIYENNKVEVGTTPIYEGETPTKEKDYEYEYIFKGWDKPLEPIFEDTYYNAVFTKERYYYPISMAIEWDETNNKPVYEGKTIKFEDVKISAIYSDTSFAIQQTGYVAVYASIDVKSIEPITDTFEFEDVVHVTGTISSYQDRAVLINASLTWGTYGEGEKESVTRVKIDDREYWNEEINRAQSGLIYYGDFQIASLPNDIVEGEDLSFYVTFPGEDLSINSLNPFLIQILIPKLKEEQVTTVKNKINNLEVSKGIELTFQPTYSNGVMNGVLVYDLLLPSSQNIPIELDNIYSEYSLVETILSNKYEGVNFINHSHSSIYNFVVDEGYEWYEGTRTEYIKVSMYTYSENDVLENIINEYNSSSSWTDEGIIDDEHYYTYDYSTNWYLKLSYKEYLGKVVFMTHLREK